VPLRVQPGTFNSFAPTRHVRIPDSCSGQIDRADTQEPVLVARKLNPKPVQRIGQAVQR
jgi:hypothetical protein